MEINTLLRGDREAKFEEWLEKQGVDNTWDDAPNLVNLGYSVNDLSASVYDFGPSSIPIVVEWVNCICMVYTLLEEINHGAKRISAIVGSLKDYTYLDQSPDSVH